MGWASLLQFFFPRKARQNDRSYTTIDEFHRLDTAMHLKSNFHEEGLIIENGEVVGETAVVTEEKTLKPTGGPLPSRYQILQRESLLMNYSVNNMHTFDPNCNVLLDTCRCVVFLLIEFETHRGFATGFYVDKRYVVSAGHCFYDSYNRADTIKSILATFPGVPNVDFDKLHNEELCTLNFKVINNLYDPLHAKREHDIALLECQGGVNGPRVIRLSTEFPPPDAIVDVIGYPAFISDPSYLVTTKYKLKDLARALERIRTLLPMFSLTVSRGTIESTGKMISYNASTIPGMSGSCLLYRGNVVGIFISANKFSK
jgi:Trypsin-like peptidase domain